MNEIIIEKLYDLFQLEILFRFKERSTVQNALKAKLTFITK